MKKFIKSFHGLRGIASFMVLIAHITWGYNNHVYSFYSERMQAYVSSIGTFGVEVFFILSGFVIYNASFNSKVSVFFKNRFWRIYPVFFLFTALYFFMNTYFNLDPSKNNILYFFSNLLFLDLLFDTPTLSPNAWSLTFEVWYYVVTFFIVRGWCNKKLDFFTFFSICLLILFLVYYPITVYFVLGVILAILNKVKVENEKGAYVNLIQFLSLFIVLYLLIIDVKFASDGWGSLLLNYREIFLPVSLFVFVYTLLQNKSFFSKVLSCRPVCFLGTISYSLYLLHPYTYRLSRFIIENSPIESPSVNFITYLFISVGLSIYFSYLLNKYFENFIFNYFSKRNIYK